MKNKESNPGQGSEGGKALLACGEYGLEVVYPAEVQERLRGICEVVDVLTTKGKELPGNRVYNGVEFLFTSWGCPHLTAETLARLPDLRAVLYGAGSIRHFVTDTFWETGIPIISAWALNAIPVAEFTFAQMILSLKKAHHAARMIRESGSWRTAAVPGRRGTYGATVGLVSYGQIARLVRERLKTLDAVEVLVYDPFLSDDEAAMEDVRKVSLAEVFAASEVVSLHTPWLPETEGLVNAALLRSMIPGSTLINTARGAIINESDLITVLGERADLQVILDVTHPEPPPNGSPLYQLPNVLMTPHIAGSIDRECARMGMTMIDECARILSGEPPRYAISREKSLLMA